MDLCLRDLRFSTGLAKLRQLFMFSIGLLQNTQYHVSRQSLEILHSKRIEELVTKGLRLG